MQLKILSKRAMLIFAITGFSFFAVAFFYFFPENLIQDDLAALVKNDAVFSGQTKTSFALPSRLKIPKINIDIALERVGLTAQGAVDVPKSHSNGAWFDLSPRPGENGNAIITGHYGYWKKGDPAIFNNLYKLQKGDKINIEDEKGATITFVVRESRIYSPNAKAPDVFISNDGKSHLNLITCQGVWENAKKTYSNRLVIFADRVYNLIQIKKYDQ